MQSPTSSAHHTAQSHPAVLPTLAPILRPLPTYQTLSSQHHPLQPTHNHNNVNTIPPNQQTTTQPSAQQPSRHVSTISRSPSQFHASHSLSPPSTPPRPPKRPRLDPRLQSRRAEIAKAAHHLRVDGIPPHTLFFPCLPRELRKDAALRAALSAPLQQMKTHQANNKKMAWATFTSETDCLETLLALYMSFPTLKVSLHRPRDAAHGVSSYQVQSNVRLFDERVRDVQRRGGLGNTLMLRNLPVQVGCDELEVVVRAALRADSVPSMSLRVRTALSKGGSGRNFWIVYADVEPCRLVFAHLFGRRVSFRCGKEVRLHPIVHDDSTDADESKRRMRARALGMQESKGGGSVGSGEGEGKCCVEQLEELLRMTQSRFVFLSETHMGD